MKWINKILCVFSILTLFSACLQVETRIKMQMDGTVLITEEVAFTKRLLDYKDGNGQAILSKYLTEASCQERAKLFGEGTTLVKFNVIDKVGGVKVLKAEYKNADINNIQIFSPYLCFTNLAETRDAKFRMKPVLKSNNYVGTAGEMQLDIITINKGTQANVVKKDDPRIPPPDPVILQEYRDLQPVFKDLMKDLKVQLWFDCYAPIHTAFGYRGKGSLPRSCEILSFTGEDYDQFGNRMVDNDEAMHEILRLEFGEFNFIKACQQFPNNTSVPVIQDDGSPYRRWRGNTGIYFSPSMALFKKHFEGQKLDFDRWGKDNFNTPATFDRIGFKEEAEAPKKEKPVEPVAPQGETKEEGNKKGEESAK